MPQQSDDLQIKWQKCLHETFFACDVVYRYAPYLEKFEEVVNLIIIYAKQWCESLQEVARRFMEVIRPAFQKLSEVFNDLKDTYEDPVEKPVEKKSYPHSYPHNVHKYNTRGYPRPIYRCARSRC